MRLVTLERRGAIRTVGTGQRPIKRHGGATVGAAHLVLVGQSDLFACVEPFEPFAIVVFDNLRRLGCGQCLLVPTELTLQLLHPNAEDQVGPALLARKQPPPALFWRDLGAIRPTFLERRIERFLGHGGHPGPGDTRAKHVDRRSRDDSSRRPVTHLRMRKVPRNYLAAGMGGGATNEPASAGTCPAGCHSAMPAVQTSVSRVT